MTITPLYAGLLALLFVFLSMRVIGVRHAIKVALGDGGDRTLMRRQRAHGNFAEYVPLALVLLLLAELQSRPEWTLHVTGLLLLIGRAAHAYSVSQEPEPLKIRTLGMVMTFAALIMGALNNLAGAVIPLAARG